MNIRKATEQDIDRITEIYSAIHAKIRHLNIKSDYNQNLVQSNLENESTDILSTISTKNVVSSEKRMYSLSL